MASIRLSSEAVAFLLAALTLVKLGQLIMVGFVAVPPFLCGVFLDHPRWNMPMLFRRYQYRQPFGNLVCLTAQPVPN